MTLTARARQTRSASTSRTAHPYAGTRHLLRLAWRRDRVLIPVSVLGLTGLSVGSAQATFALYPNDAAAAKDLGAILGNPAVVALYGPVASQTRDALSVFKTLLMGAIFLAIVGYALVRRHTRCEEEDGRLELLGSSVVGRLAPLTAAIVLSSTTVVVTAACSAAGLAVVGLQPTGSVAFGVAWAVTGLAMVAVSAVAAQLTVTARGTTTLALGTLALGYLMRALGDTDASLSWLSWLSFVGWSGKVAAYGANRIWVGLLGLAFAALLIAAAYLLQARRDLGAGALPPRPGAARGAAALGTPLGLAWRLSRGTVIVSVVAMVVLGGVLGSLLGAVEQMAGNPQIEQMLRTLGGSAGTLADIFLATEFAFASAAAAAAGVGLTLRVAAEERAARSEAVLASAVPRARWLAAFGGLGFGLSLSLLVVLGVAVSLVPGAHGGAAPGIVDLVAAGLAHWPAAAVCVAVALAGSGLTARLAPAFGWGFLALTFVLAEFGPLLSFPAWLIDLSPFAHSSQLPGGSLSWGGTLGLLVVAIALAAVAVVGYQRRDVV